MTHYIPGYGLPATLGNSSRYNLVGLGAITRRGNTPELLRSPDRSGTDRDCKPNVARFGCPGQSSGRNASVQSM